MTTTATRLNVGVIGAGFVATSVHIPFLKGLETANVVAVADSVPGRASAAASRYAIPLHTSDYRTLLANEDIQVIDICTPPQSHAQIAIEAVGAGKDVILEKPLAMNLREFDSISGALGRATDSHIGLVLNLRYMPLVHSVVQMLHSGRLGEVRGASALIRTAAPAVDWFTDDVLSRYGVLYDYLPHILDVVMWALQATPISVRCAASSSGSRGYYLIIEMRSPLTGVCSLLVDVAWTSATSIRSLQFWGTERDLFVDLQDQFSYLGRGHLTPIKRGEEFARRMAALAKRTAGGRFSIKYGAMVYHRDLLSDFLAAFAARRCPRVSLAEGFHHVAVIDAAVRSHTEDRAVAVSAGPLVLR